MIVTPPSTSSSLNTMMKANSQFDLIPEEQEGDSDQPMQTGSSAAAGGTPPQQHILIPQQQAAAMAAAAAAAAQRPNVLNDIAIQQHMLQVKQQQIFQQQFLEQQFQRNREILRAEHEKQLSVILQQVEVQRKMKESAVMEQERKEKLRLEVLRSKTEREQSAVASPEVKRHLAEFVLQKRRKEAAASMGNLNKVPQAAPAAAPAILRKTASESNLYKMKSKRNSSVSSPYQRHLPTQPVIPEATVVSEQSPISSAGSSCSSSFHPQDLSLRSNSHHGSAPTSPKTSSNESPTSTDPGSVRGIHHRLAEASPRSSLPSILALKGSLNSKSLPNIPTAVGRLVSQEALIKAGRKSPPSYTTTSSIRPPPHHSAMLVRRSNSSAILPLRKHLMEKTMQEKKAMDEEQFYFQQKQKARERLMIRPIEEVMEEDKPSGSDSMEVDLDERPKTVSVRLGPSGISPLVLNEVTEYRPEQQMTGLGFDPIMLKHMCSCDNPNNHPEHPGRVQVIWNRLVETGLANQCVRVARCAALEEIQSCHSETHTLVHGTDMINRCSLTGSQELRRDNRLGKFSPLDCGGLGVDSDTYWNELYTAPAVRTAVGTVIELSQKVAKGELRNAFALVRPPGHHAEYEEAMGFCYFNTVSIAAKQLLRHNLASRILIIDWAIHHGNGTQKYFYDNPNVLYISLHRHDNGNFYPGTGGAVECGTGPGLGFNVNIAWTGGLDPPMADAEYLAAFRSVVMPVARSFNPDIVLVSAGFDAAAGHPHPIGGYHVSTACFAYMTLQLRQLAQGKVVLALEGGFNLEVLATASEQCVRALLGLPIEKIAEGELARRPNQPAMETLQRTLAIHTPYWEVLKRNAEAALLSHLEAWEKEKGECEALSAMASLSVQPLRSREMIATAGPEQQTTRA